MQYDTSCGAAEAVAETTVDNTATSVEFLISL